MVMKIRELREAKGLRQNQLAESMGEIPSVICNWEKEVALPKTRQLPRLAQVLECSIDELFVPIEDAS